MIFKTTITNYIITICFLLALSSHMALAGVTISGTRVIFPGGEREKSIRTNNKGKTPVLVQVWVDDGSKDGDVNKMKVPFTATPPVYRIEPGKGQSVRLIYNGMALPQDRESVFWFNLLEIPPANASMQKTDHLELAFRTRIKIFYRPDTLKSSSINQIEQLKWGISPGGNGITVSNPTPYYFSFESASIYSGNKKYKLMTEMVAPFSNKTFSVEGNKSLASTVSKIEFRVLSDYGSQVDRTLIPESGKGFVLKQ